MDKQRDDSEKTSGTLKKAVDDLLQKDQLDNDKSHAGDKPAMSDNNPPVQPQE